MGFGGLNSGLVGLIEENDGRSRALIYMIMVLTIARLLVSVARIVLPNSFQLLPVPHNPAPHSTMKKVFRLQPPRPSSAYLVPAASF